MCVIRVYKSIYYYFFAFPTLLYILSSHKSYDSNAKLLQKAFLLHIMNKMLFIYWIDYEILIFLQSCTDGFTYDRRARQCIG